jgi:galactose oxidase
MLHPNIFGLLTAVTLFQTAHSLNACSGADTVFTGTGGIRYRICPNTDLTGLSTSVTPNIASVTACAKLCDQSMNCFKAVWDTKTRDCHFKGLTKLKWVDNTRFNVIQAEQVNIARCPSAETTYKAGGVSCDYRVQTSNHSNVRSQKNFKICKDTDLRGKTAQVIKGVANVNDCAQRCSTTPTCIQAVFDSALQVCHIKADLKTDTLIWSTDKRFDVIRQDIPAAPAKDGAWSDLIHLPVIPVAAYVVPEYPTSQRLLVFSSWGADSFGGEGGRTQFADYNFTS